MKAIRFAPLVRVSTESQERRGESLRTQKTQILQYVKSLGGVIPDNLWKYSGQEHATVGGERKNLDLLLEDSSKDLFDAVITCDASRWSRDNQKSKAGLKILKQNGIRFFVGTTEFDLFLPQASLFLGMSTEMNEFFSLEQARKSLLNRIERAKRGIPTGGKLPYGRTFNKETGQWGLDAEKVKNIQWAADSYLKGESLMEIAETLDMNMTNLWKTLNKRSGDEWAVSFSSRRLNIKKTVPITIPRLLPQDIIGQVHERAKSNKTYTHGCSKNQYLLSRMVFCGHCGYTMFGQTNHNEKRYYRHARHRKKECDIGFWVRADALENTVMKRLFSMYGDRSSLEKAMTRAIPDNRKIVKLRAQKQTLEKQLQKTDADLQRVIKSISKGFISDEEAEKVLTEIRERSALLTDQIEKIRPQIENVPSEALIKNRAKLIKRTLEAIFTRPERLEKMSFEEKRKVVQSAFGGKDANGKRCGVYLYKPVKDSGPVTYEAKGIFDDIQGELPVSDKQDLFSKRHAHYRLGFYQRR